MENNNINNNNNNNNNNDNNNASDDFVDSRFHAHEIDAIDGLIEQQMFEQHLREIGSFYNLMTRRNNNNNNNNNNNTVRTRSRHNTNDNDYDNDAMNEDVVEYEESEEEEQERMMNFILNRHGYFNTDDDEGEWEGAGYYPSGHGGYPDYDHDDDIESDYNNDYYSYNQNYTNSNNNNNNNNNNDEDDEEMEGEEDNEPELEEDEVNEVNDNDDNDNDDDEEEENEEDSEEEDEEDEEEEDDDEEEEDEDEDEANHLETILSSVVNSIRRRQREILAALEGGNGTSRNTARNSSNVDSHNNNTNNNTNNNNNNNNNYDSNNDNSSDETKPNEEEPNSTGTRLYLSNPTASSLRATAMMDTSSSSSSSTSSTHLTDWVPKPSSELYNPYFFSSHVRSVRGVSFSPTVPNVFCSAGYDGIVNFYNARTKTQTHSASVAPMRHLNCVTYSSNSELVFVGCVNRKLFALNSSTGEIVNTYAECVYNGSDRAALVASSTLEGGSSNIVVCTTVNGRGLSVIDTREAKPIRSLSNIHNGVIRDVQFIHNVWSGKYGGKLTMITASQDGTSAIVDIDGKILKIFEAGCPLYSVTVTPEPLGQSITGTQSNVVLGGDKLIILSAEGHVKQYFHENNYAPIWKLSYTSTGSYLYVACDDGVVRRYMRTRRNHIFEREILTHAASDIEDMALSINDEYVVTASRDERVGLIRFGTPSFGCCEYGDLN